MKPPLFCPLFLLIYSFLKSWLKQICVKSLAGAVEKAYWLMWSSCITFQQLYLKAPASHFVPLFLPPSPPLPHLLTTLYLRMWIFLPFEKNKSSVIKISCLGCFFCLKQWNILAICVADITVTPDQCVAAVLELSAESHDLLSGWSLPMEL